MYLSKGKYFRSVTVTKGECTGVGKYDKDILGILEALNLPKSKNDV